MSVREVSAFAGGEEKALAAARPASVRSESRARRVA